MLNSNFNKNDKDKKYLSITAKLILLSAVFIIFTSIVSGFVQIYQFKKQGIEDLKDKINEISKSELIPLSLALWDLDDEKIDLHLEGILSITYVEKVEISSDSFKKSVGKIYSKDILEKRFPISYFDQSAQQEKMLGTLIISIGLNEIKNKAWLMTKKFIFSEISQIILTCIFMVFLIETLVNKKLKILNKHTTHLKDKKVFKSLFINSQIMFNDEFDTFIENFNALNLERDQHFKLMEEKLTQKNLEFKNILESIDIGMTIILPNLSLQKEYLKFLPSIFLSSGPEKQNLISLIFSISTLKQSEVLQIEDALKEMIGSLVYIYEAKKELLPSELSVYDDNNKIHFFKLKWVPIITNDSFVKKMILQLISSDEEHQKINIAKLQQRLEIMNEISLSPNKDTSDLIKLAKYYINQNFLLLTEHYSKSSFLSSHEIVEVTNRFNLIQNLASNANLTFLKQRLQSSQKNITNNKKELRILHNNLLGLLSEYSEIQKEIITQNPLISVEPESKGSIKINAKVASKLVDEIDLLRNEFQTKKIETILGKIKHLFESSKSKRVKSILHNEFKQIPYLTSILDKEVPRIQISDKGIEINAEIYTEFQTIFTHLLRNSLFHGIEEPHLREIHGKEKTGQIDIIFEQREENKIQISFRDDGQGIDLEQIRKYIPKENEFNTETQTRTIDEIINLSLLNNNLESSPSIKKDEFLNPKLKGLKTIARMIEKLSGEIFIRPLPLPIKVEGYYPFEIVIQLPDRYFSINKQTINA